MLYNNIAHIYAHSRPPYPQELFDLIVSKTSLDNHELYIDLGCGTGELLIPLSKHFRTSIGVDPTQDMLKMATEKIEIATSNPIALINATAEDYLLQLPPDTVLDLVTAGRSFHWMQQEFVAGAVYRRLKTGGVFITLGEANGGIWKRDTEWAHAVRHIVFQGYPHKELFIPIKGYAACHETIKNNIRKFPFNTIEDFVIEIEQQWDVQKIINLFYSGSGFLEWLGTDRQDFETKVHGALSAINPSGSFNDITQFGITCCTK